MTRLLIVDDEPSVRETLELFLVREGYDVSCAANGREALESIHNHAPEVVLSDIRMPQMDGFALLREIKKINPAIQVLMITAFSSSSDAVAAMREGAYDYITKPFDLKEIRQLVLNAVDKHRLLRENRALKKELSRHQEIGMIGRSEPMRQVFSMIQQVAASRTTVLISGDSGTGKELVARGIHKLSDRSKMPFIAVNCGAISAELMESELFGHVKGAFTGAVSEKNGMFQEANGGTIFLDEVSELPLDLQVKLLRVLESRNVRKVGSPRELEVDVRVIAATNRDLLAYTNEGNFREDLFFRLNVINIHVPPLRQRRDDIPRLVHFFLQRSCKDLGRPMMTMSPEAMDALLHYPFPGNVRELLNIIERAVTLSRSPVIDIRLLPEQVARAVPTRRSHPPVDDTATAPVGPLLHVSNAEEQTVITAVPQPDQGLPAKTAPVPRDTPTQRSGEMTLPVNIGSGLELEALLEKVEIHYLEKALKLTNGVKKDAAHLLGLSFRSFRYRLQKLGLDKD